MLFAHTEAFLTLSGLMDGKAFDIPKATKILGNTAIKYHSNNGNFNKGINGLVLTPKGIAFFNARGKANPELVNAYIDFFDNGKVNEKINIKAESSRVILK
jgi:hypothetical protein